MGLIYQKDKRVGITYVYENESYWDKEKQQPRSRRTLIGRLDEESGEIVPTDGRRKKRKTVKDGQDVNYKKLYEKLLSAYAAQEVLMAALKKELAALKR